MQMLKITSSILVASLAFVSSASAQCEDCDTAAGNFCGSDGKCYPYNCKVFYKFGSWRDEIPAEADIGANLTCSRRDVVPTWNVYCGGGVKYGCSYCDDGPVGDEDGDIIQPFSRDCTAELLNGAFTCFDLAGADFSNLQKKAAVRQMPCDEPVFMYQTHYEINGEGFSPYQKNLSYWNILSAYTLQANITYVMPTESPTPSPSSSPTEAPQEAAPESVSEPDTQSSSRGIVEVARGLLLASLFAGSITQFL